MNIDKNKIESLINQIEGKAHDSGMKDGIGHWYRSYDCSDENHFELLKTICEKKKWNLLPTAMDLRSIENPQIGVNVAILLLKELPNAEVNKYTTAAASDYFYYMFEHLINYINLLPGDSPGNIVRASLQMVLQYLERSCESQRDMSFRTSDLVIYRLFESDRYEVVADVFHDQFIDTLLVYLKSFDSFTNGDTDSVLHKAIVMMTDCCNFDDEAEFSEVSMAYRKLLESLENERKKGQNERSIGYIISNIKCLLRKERSEIK